MLDLSYTDIESLREAQVRTLQCALFLLTDMLRLITCLLNMPRPYRYARFVDSMTIPSAVVGKVSDYHTLPSNYFIIAARPAVNIERNSLWIRTDTKTIPFKRYLRMILESAPRAHFDVVAAL